MVTQIWMLNITQKRLVQLTFQFCDLLRHPSWCLFATCSIKIDTQMRPAYGAVELKSKILCCFLLFYLRNSTFSICGCKITYLLKYTEECFVAFLCVTFEFYFLFSVWDDQRPNTAESVFEYWIPRGRQAEKHPGYIFPDLVFDLLFNSVEIF